MALLRGPAVDLSTWDPEDEEHWDKRFAWQTLWITTYTLMLAFAVWYLVSAIAPRLNSIGYDLSKPELYWLVAVPGLAGGFMRLIYMFLPPVRRHAHSRRRLCDAHAAPDGGLDARRA